MSSVDEKQVERLTELARKAFGDGTCIERDHNAFLVIGPIQRGNGSVWTSEEIRMNPHPRALDALEAALCVLAGEPLAIHLNAEVQLALNDRMARKAMDAQARAETAESKVRELTEALQEMASRWRDCEDAADAMQGNPLTVNDCASELMDALSGES